MGIVIEFNPGNKTVTKKEEEENIFCPECLSEAFVLWENGEVSCFDCGQPMAYKLVEEKLDEKE